jgi:hypothetical protein
VVDDRRRRTFGRIAATSRRKPSRTLFVHIESVTKVTRARQHSASASAARPGARAQRLEAIGNGADRLPFLCRRSTRQKHFTPDHLQAVSSPRTSARPTAMHSPLRLKRALGSTVMSTGACLREWQAFWIGGKGGVGSESVGNFFHGALKSEMERRQGSQSIRARLGGGRDGRDEFGAVDWI